jgi:hypothetical protein
MQVQDEFKFAFEYKYYALVAIGVARHATDNAKKLAEANTATRLLTYYRGFTFVNTELRVTADASLLEAQSLAAAATADLEKQAIEAKMTQESECGNDQEIEYDSAAYYQAQHEENVRVYLRKFQEMQLLDVTLRGFDAQQAKMRDELRVLWKEIDDFDRRRMQEQVRAAAELEKTSTELEKVINFELEKQAFAQRAKQFDAKEKQRVAAAEQKELEEYVFV